MSDERTSRNEPWREDLRAMYTAKQRTAIPRVRMPELTPEYAVTVDDEVLQGLSVEQAVLEARRCLDCPDPGCIKGCPVHNDIPGFIKNIERREFGTALRVIRRTSVLPAVCGRVCPQEKQCEANCTYTKMKRPAVAIGNLERFVAVGACFRRRYGAERFPGHGIRGYELVWRRAQKRHTALLLA